MAEGAQLWVSNDDFVAPVYTQTWLKHSTHDHPLKLLPFGDPREIPKNRFVNNWYVVRVGQTNSHHRDSVLSTLATGG